MSIISKALEKELLEQGRAQRLQGVEEPPGAETPKAADVIQQRTDNPPRPAVVQRIPARAAGPAASSLLPTNFGRQFFVMGGLLALVAVGVGFFMNDSLTSSRRDSKAGSDAPAQPPVAAAAPAAEAAPPAQTPLVVRVEVAVKSEQGASAPEMIPVDRQTLYEAAERVEERRAGEYEPPPLEVPDPPEPPPVRQRKEPAGKPTLAQVRETHKVDGIFYGDGDPMAIINDEIVREGFEAENYSVVKIKPDSVIIRVQGEEFELR